MRNQNLMKTHSMIFMLAAAVAVAGCTKTETSTATTTAATATSGTFAYATDTIAAATPEPQVGIEVGAMMPAYDAKGLDGAKFDLATEKGCVVLLNVWATWCGPCRYEIPELGKLNAKYAAQRFKVVGVSIDDGDDAPAAVKKFVTEKQVTYPIVLDPEAKLANIFQTSVLPTTVLIDRKGKIVWKKYGAIEAGEAELTQAIEQALKG
jgi:thiol-disulfide isomerase/thioredoxin